MNHRPQPTIWQELQPGAAVVAWCLIGHLAIGLFTLFCLLVLSWL